MKKKLGIVTLSSEVGIAYKDQLNNVFGDSLFITTHSFEKNDFSDIEDLDAVLISTNSQYEIFKNKFDKDFNMVIAKLTLSKKGFEILKECKELKSAMLVNLSLEMSLETISLLYQLGFDNIQFTPVYPNMDNFPKLDVAVTTGEQRYIPKYVKQIYDLGHRLIDKNTIVELAVSLNLEEILRKKSVTMYFESLVPYNRGIEILLGKSNTLKKQLDTLLSVMDKGVIAVDSCGIIQSCNGSAEKIVKMNQGELIGKNAKLVLPEIDFYDTPTINKLIKIKDEYISLFTFDMGENEEEFTGSYAIIEDFNSKENTQNKLRLQLMNKGHIAKYNINNIIGESEKISHVKELIKRMGKSKSSVLITGESGTGKELVAQAIHNISQNSDKHFIAINCAALSPTLLESELFGYESGAFTGASKNGKEGIFEMANNGTLFLDEIGEIPLSLQAKLLRVIQEREVRRVGGDTLIKVDVRLIAATNIDLVEQVENGLFRRDLYYRLNVLPINIPALRDRREDIVTLINYFIKKNDLKFQLKEETLEFMKEYNWRGNIRELINCMEYLENLGKNCIKIEDLPHHMKEIVRKKKFSVSSNILSNLNEKETFVLKLFYEGFLSRKKMGRKLLSEIAYDRNMYLSEYDVKSIMNKLSEEGLINISLGRGGSTISKSGIEFLEKIKQ